MNARGRDKSRPYDRRKARTLPGNRTFCGIANLCRGRFHIGPGTPRRRKRPRADMESAPTNKLYASDQTGTAVTTRATVGRDALIPPHPARRKRPRADMESAPTDDGECRGQPGNGAPAAPQTSVRDDACTAPAGAFRRPTGPQARLLGRRSSREPCGGVRFPGWDKSRPYKPSETTRQTGTGVTTRAFVGRDALIPPHPRGGANTPGGYGIRPYE